MPLQGRETHRRATHIPILRRPPGGDVLHPNRAVQDVRHALPALVLRVWCLYAGSVIHCQRVQYDSTCHRKVSTFDEKKSTFFFC